VPAPPAAPAAPPADGPGSAAWSPAAVDRLADEVLHRIERRVLARRERMGSV
jgi:hypothetical protein